MTFTQKLSALTSLAVMGGVIHAQSGTITPQGIGSVLALTSNCVVKSGGTALAPACSAMSDNGTTVVSTEPVAVGTAPTVTTPGTGFYVFGTEGTEPASVASGTSGFVDDSTSHCPIVWFDAVNDGCVDAASNAITLTNKSIALSEVNSGFTAGGVVGATSATANCMSAFSASALVKMASASSSCPAASSMTDNATDVVTTEPIVTGNTVLIAGTSSVTSTSLATFPTHALALPVIPASTTRKGYCDIIWEMGTSTSDTVEFGLNTSASSTGLYLLGSHTFTSTSVVNATLPATTAVTTATTTAVTAALPAASTTAFYQTHIDFALSTNTNAQTITVYGLVSAGTMTVELGSGCGWLP